MDEVINIENKTEQKELIAKLKPKRKIFLTMAEKLRWEKAHGKVSAQ